MQRRLVLGLACLLFGIGLAQPDLFHAATHGDRDAVAAALEQGADIDVRDAYGQTPLMYAISTGRSTDFIEMLVRNGADVNARTDAGWTPMMYAARDLRDPQFREVILLLYRAGADPTARNDEGEMASAYVRSDPPPSVVPSDPFEAITDFLAREAGFVAACGTRDAFYERRWCGQRVARMPFEAFRRHWNEALDRVDAGQDPLEPRSDWTYERGVHIAFYELAGGSLGVSFDANAGLVLLTLR